MPTKPKHKIVLFHKPTGKYASRDCKNYHAGSYRYNPSNIEDFLTADLQDCRVFTNKSAAGNAHIFQTNKEDFERVEVVLVHRSSLRNEDEYNGFR